MEKRYIPQPTGYCRYCYRKLDDFESNYVYCHYGDCKEQFYYKNSILPKRKNKGKVWNGTWNKENQWKIIKSIHETRRYRPRIKILTSDLVTLDDFVNLW